MKRARIANLLSIVGLLLVVAGALFWILNQESGGVEIVVPTPEPLIVQITGEVNVPGSYELSRGSRVGDLIDAAGGTTLQADISDINFAEPLDDGENVEVAAIPTPTPVPIPTVTPSEPDSGPVTATTTPAESDETELIDLNTASLEELTRLNGVGPATAQKIVEWRESRGTPIESAEELTQVSGIGAKTVDGLRDQVVQR